MWRQDLGPIGFVALALLVAFGAVAMTLIVPAFVAAAGGVFYSAGIRPKLPRAASVPMAAFEADQERRERILHRLDELIDQRVAGAPHDSSVISLFQLREQVAKAKRDAVPPVAIIPFYLNPQMLLWPAAITCLLWIAILMTPARNLTFWRVLRSRKTIELGVATYLFYEWPLWLRNFALNDDGRVVYAYPNVDIYAPSFVMQECIILTFCMLLGVIWRQWSVYLLRVRQDDPVGSNVNDHIGVLTDAAAATSFREVFLRWVSCSVLLALAFAGLTAFYWDLVGKYHDQRYLLSAILAHVLWGLTWLVLSLPLLNEWRVWDISRTYALQKLALMSDSEEALRRAAMVKEIQPVSASTLIVANAVSVVSFVLPIVQAFVH
jgi:hypothetical protein